jgi:hypothetical protein
LSFKELEFVVENADANSTWHDKLSSVYGIYLILDTISGKEYIGSAYGEEGIWGRWVTYKETGHGNNQELKKLLENDENYKYNFQFTVLRTLPGNLKPTEVVECENLYKQKLGSRTFGLNRN